MKLFETAFAYVQRALRGGRQVVELEDEAPERTSIVLLMDPDPAPVAEPIAESAAEPEPTDDFADEFADLLSGIGAVDTPAGEVSDLDRKDREIGELQRNLEMLRPIGDELARVEQLRLAERASFETELSDLRDELQAARATEASVGPEATSGPSAQGLRDVSRLIAALDSTLSNAHTTPGAPTPEDAASEQHQAEERLARTRAHLASARKRLSEQKRKTAHRRAEAQELRGQVKVLERQQRTLLAERRKFYAPVRELARRAKRRSQPLSRLIELLGLEID